MRTRGLALLLLIAFSAAGGLAAPAAAGTATYDSATVQFTPWPDARAYDVTVDEVGRAVLVGSAMRFVDHSYRRVWAMTRVRADGRLDPTFGDGGKVVGVVPFRGDAEQVAARPGGGYYVAGLIRSGDSLGYAVSAINEDGSLDPTWGEGGTVTWLGDRWRYQYGLKVDDDGSVALLTTSAGDGWDPTVVTYSADGTLESEAVGDNPPIYQFDDLHLRADGGFVAAKGTYVPGEPHAVALTAYEADGSPDESFGRHGHVVHGIGRVDLFVRKVAVDGQGRILAAGVILPPHYDGSERWGVMRFRPDGRVDRTFGTDGIARTGAAHSVDVSDVRVLSDGRILLAGTWNGRLRVMALAADGSVASPSVLGYGHRSAGSALAVAGGRVYAAGWRIEPAHEGSMLLVSGGRRTLFGP